MTRAAAALVAGVALLAVAGPATAAMLEISTSVAAADADDPNVLNAAIRTAVDEVVNDGLPFTPTVAVLTRAYMAGGRLYVRVLLSDEDTGPGDHVAAAGIY